MAKDSPEYKKTERKLKKYLTSIQKDVNLETSELPTKFILVCNAGLITGNSREQIFELSSQFSKTKNVYMILGKSFSFIEFSDLINSEPFFKNVNGKPLSELDRRPLYLCYLKSLPNIINSNTSNELPVGLHLLEDFISEEEEDKFLQTIKWEEESSQLKHRKVKHYGYAFLYETNNIDKDNPLDEKIPETFSDVLEKLLKTQLVEERPDQLTVNQYQPGQGIPPHIDTHSAFEEALVSISLGSSVVMDFHHPDGRHVPVFLPRRSCVIMRGESRYVWSHGITPRKSDVIQGPDGVTLQQRETRTSLTFRKVLRNPCSCPFPQFCDSQANTKTEDMADQLEKLHVFKVYEEIAPHFSDTRHKPWPAVLDFVHSLAKGSLLADVGCGNGKYLGHTKHVYEIGCDRSHNLLSLCRSRGAEVFPADCRTVPLRSGIADACICIAVIHHLASDERRIQAIKEITRLLTVGGRALIYVWAREQQRGEKKSTYLLQQKKDEKKKEVIDRPKDSLLPIHQNRTNFSHSDVLVPWKLNPKTASLKDKPTEETVFHRFYHVFSEGELENLCQQVGGIEIEKSYYDQGNWCTVFRKVY